MADSGLCPSRRTNKDVRNRPHFSRFSNILSSLATHCLVTVTMVVQSSCNRNLTAFTVRTSASMASGAGDDPLITSFPIVLQQSTNTAGSKCNDTVPISTSSLRMSKQDQHLECCPNVCPKDCPNSCPGVFTVVFPGCPGNWLRHSSGNSVVDFPGVGPVDWSEVLSGNGCSAVVIGSCPTNFLMSSVTSLSRTHYRYIQ